MISSVIEAMEIYAGYLRDLPDIVLMRRPSQYRSPSLVMGKFAAQYCETPNELQAVLNWTKAEPTHMTTPRGPALDLRGPLSTPAPRRKMGFCAGYAPPAEGWPWLVVVRVPIPQPAGYGRGVYGIDAFASESAWLDHIAKLNSRHPRPVIVPDPKIAH